MRSFTFALLAATALAGCASNSGVKTTPTYAPARYVPTTPQPPKATQATPRRVTMAPVGGTVASGARAVAAANRSATIDPDYRTMRGATWFIEDHDPTMIYRVPMAPGRVTTLLLPAGEKFNGAVGGNVEAFLINVAYAGPRPAVSILPRSGSAKGNLQIVTTGGFYPFDLAVTRHTAVNLVDVTRETQATGAAASLVPQPEGDFTRLSFAEPEGKPLPAWAPAEAWADSRKMVVRFNTPAPELPALFAGQQGEQMVSYRSVGDGMGSLYLITSRRVTEAELRMDAERVRITVDADAIRAGTGADPALGAEGWQNAQSLPPATAQPTGSNVAVFVMPQANGGTALTTNPFGPPPALKAVDPDQPLANQGMVPPPAKQPMANNVIRM